MWREWAVLVARPSRYDSGKHPTDAELLCLNGATDADLAREFGVCESTINNWKHRHAEFLESVSRGKAVADAAVVRALHQRAMGYRFTTTKTVKKLIAAKGDKPAMVEVTETTTDTFIPPDPTACIFWLKNRDPERWRDRPTDGNAQASQDRIRAFLEAVSPSEEEVAALFADHSDAVDAESAS